MKNLTQAQLKQALDIATTTTVNGVYAVNTKLQLKDSARSIIRSVATKYSVDTPFEFLLSILSDSVIDTTIFGNTNVVGHTNEKQILESAAEARKGNRGDWINHTSNFDNRLSEVIEKFGDGKLGFDVYSFIVAMPEDLDYILREVASRNYCLIRPRPEYTLYND